VLLPEITGNEFLGFKLISVKTAADFFSRCHLTIMPVPQIWLVRIDAG
jgi:hypothetical protein